MALSPDDWTLVTDIAKAAQANFSITDAKDWPMFLGMLKLLGISLAGVLGLGLYIWRDLKKSISSRRAEDATRCQSCKTDIWAHIDGPLWNAIKDCCGFMSKDAREDLRAKIKRHTEDAEHA